ncbi:hypothetical protein EMPS_05700 [Entomortierella parvispora]|uniref:Phosphoglycerate mutase-like protein n=1 Tax=Entomortierella parvispora TaxID=205924 RepID=A0A9P3LWR3_9FUNG|nr:hypothetical protein EMPS_05700 [Entomortierella parvispora]
MHVFNLAFVAASVLALQAAGQSYNETLYNNYNYCQGITPVAKQTYQPIAAAKLLKVQVMMRHGDRTPTAVLPGKQVDYDICSNPAELTSVGGNSKTQSPLLKPLITITEDNPFADIFWTGNCEVGQLTDRGQNQTFQVGKDLRGIYVDLLKFIPQFLDTSKLYVRNTYVWRTRVSAENMLNGLYPLPCRSPGVEIEMDTFPETIETMTLNTACAKGVSIYEAFIKTPTFLNFYKQNYALMTKINTILGVENIAQTNETLNGDTLMPRYCNNIPLPCSATNSSDCITGDEAAQAIAGTMFYAHGPLRYEAGAEEAKRLTSGPFLKTLANGIRGTVNGTSGVKPFEFYSAHDATIDQNLAVIADPDTPWPGYASTLILETWELEANSTTGAKAGDQVVRALFEGRVVPANPNLNCTLDACPLDTFLSFIESYVPADMMSECAM